MSEIKVRQATAAEAGRIADFNRAMALETEGLALDEKTVAAGAVALIGHPDRGFYLVAEVAGAVAGCLLITYEWSDWRNASIWWFQSVYVIPEYRRKGIFRMMYDHVKKEGMECGIAGLRLYVESENVRAQKTYEAMGMNGNHYRTFEWMV